MIAAVILVLLLAVAVPTYQGQVRASRRAEGRSLLLESANRMERFAADNTAFTADMTALGYAASPAPTPGGWYQVSAAVTATTYTLTAAPQGDQVNDTQCGSLTLSSAGLRGQSGAGPCW
jgi:type IV pilus assembly protein PilE